MEKNLFYFPVMQIIFFFFVIKKHLFDCSSNYLVLEMSKYMFNGIASSLVFAASYFLRSLSSQQKTSRNLSCFWCSCFLSFSAELYSQHTSKDLHMLMQGWICLRCLLKHVAIFYMLFLSVSFLLGGESWTGHIY